MRTKVIKRKDKQTDKQFYTVKRDHFTTLKTTLPVLKIPFPVQ
jgi:hypothetical protein